jgi:methylase of polypeptide subunit release factors
MRRDEVANRELFATRYGVTRQELNRVIERAVIGGDWGANGYTTLAEADELGRILDLRPGALLLDVGAGRGWPGLYLASARGCSVLLADLPVEALRAAQDRARTEGLADRVAAVVATAVDLPVRAGSVDAIVSTDVLC